MKKITTALILILSGINSFSQDWKPSEKYKIIGLEFEKRMKKFEFSDNDTMIAYLVHSNDTSDIYKGYSISNYETYDSVYVREWVNPGYRNVDRIIWVQFEYAACCYDYDVKYYIITIDGQWHSLPDIYYTMCDFPGEIEEFEYDPENNIFNRVINMYVDIGRIEETTNVETLFWDGKTITGPE